MNNINTGAFYEYDVCIIGTGRVGLPLALSFTEAGLKVLGVEIDKYVRDTVNAGKMPFDEPGYDKLIAKRDLIVSNDMAEVQRCKAIVITVGTPLHNHIETDISQIRRVLEEAAPYLQPGQLICLRSTVAPGTTSLVLKWLNQNTKLNFGSELGLVFSPERIAEGSAYSEIRSLPQIIGSEDDMSKKMGEELFSHLVSDILHTNFVSAELTKLFNNIIRYSHFAIANQLTIVAEQFGANIHEVRRMVNYKYPRGQMALPGLTGGTCLRKDFGMINEFTPYSDMFLSSWKVNEYMPAFLVRRAVNKISLNDKIVAVMGYTFKNDTDDIRDSLVPKVIRYIEREAPCEVRVSDHNLPNPIPDHENGIRRNWKAEEAYSEADCIFITIPHIGYSSVLERVSIEKPDTWIVDIWNIGGIERILYQAKDLQIKNKNATVTGKVQKQ